METEQSPDLRFAVIAVDVVILTVKDNQLNVLLVKPNQGPFVGSWALPGGLVHPAEDLLAAARRNLLTKTGLGSIYLEQLYTFGRVDRDPRGRVVSTAYFALVPADQGELRTTEAYDEIRWVPVATIEKLAYDHFEILATALARLRAKLEYTNIIYGLLPAKFTLSEMQHLYETILNRAIDKRNFRKKLLSLNLIRPAKEKRVGDPNRPAQLYEFIHREPRNVEVL